MRTVYRVRRHWRSLARVCMSPDANDTMLKRRRCGMATYSSPLNRQITTCEGFQPASGASRTQPAACPGARLCRGCGVAGGVGLAGLQCLLCGAKTIATVWCGPRVQIECCIYAGRAAARLPRRPPGRPGVSFYWQGFVRLPRASAAAAV